jgi:hypothetical protein
MPFFDPTEEEERSFLSVLRHTVLEGPLHLVRFTSASCDYKTAYGRKDKKTGLYSSYWMYASEVEELLDGVSGGGPYGIQVIKEASSRWAICDDWSDMGRMWVLSIPRGSMLNAYFGFAKFQPKISRRTQRETGRHTTNSYPGGSIQLVVRLSDNECSWISGPLRTLDVSSKKLRTLYA